MRCSNTTFYVNGHQIRVADITSATLDGTPVDVTDLPFLTTSGLLQLTTRYGDTTIDVDHTRLHGRKARTGTQPDQAVAALALANLATHPTRRESATHARKVAAQALRTVDDTTLAALLADHPAAPHVWNRFAAGHVALRAWRNPTLASALHATGATPLTGHAATTADRPNVTVNPEASDARFEDAVRNGNRPKARGWSQRATLAATFPDVAARLIDDPHPLVRAAAYRHATLDQLTEAVNGDVDPTARRNAAAALATRFQVPLTTEGTIAGTLRHTRSGRPDIVFVDVDGTLVDGPAHIDMATVNVLQQAQRAGVHIVAVTGRTVDTFTALNLGVELAVCDGTIVDMVSMTRLGNVTDKGAAVEQLCSMLGTDRCAGAGDGAVDRTMFAAIRERGGRCAWPVTGQAAAATMATDIVGPVGSGGVGRFIDDLMTNRTRPEVPGIQVTDTRTTNYAAHLVPPNRFAELTERHQLQPDGWAAAHGHVTTAYPDRGVDPASLPVPQPGATVEVYGTVRTDRCTAFAVRVDGETHRPDGTPYHLTVALAPTGPGKFEPPAVAGNAVAAALRDGTLEPVDPEVIPTIAAPVGTPTNPLPDQLADLVAGSSRHDATLWHRVAAGGFAPEAFAAHIDAPLPIQRALEDGGRLEAGMVVLVGPPAAGKSTLARTLTETCGAVVVNLDGIRGELNGDEGAQQRPRDVVALGAARLATELSLGRLVVSDATNVRAAAVRDHVTRAHRAGLPVVAVPVVVDKPTALERDRERAESGRRAIGNTPNGWDATLAEQILDRMYHGWRTSVRELQNPQELGVDAVVPADTLTRP